MCNCYDHKCNSTKCNELIPIHIGDWCTPQENLEVLCPRHLPKNLVDFKGAVWKWLAEDTTSQEDRHIPKGYKCGIRIVDLNKIDKPYRDLSYIDQWQDIVHPNSTKVTRIKDW